jgi:hypothetical protein
VVDVVVGVVLAGCRQVPLALGDGLQHAQHPVRDVLRQEARDAHDAAVVLQQPVQVEPPEPLADGGVGADPGAPAAPCRLLLLGLLLLGLLLGLPLLLLLLRSGALAHLCGEEEEAGRRSEQQVLCVRLAVRCAGRRGGAVSGPGGAFEAICNMARLLSDESRVNRRRGPRHADLLLFLCADCCCAFHHRTITPASR